MENTPRDSLDGILGVFGEYREASISLRGSIAGFLEKAENAKELAYVLEIVLRMDGRYLKAIDEVDHNLEYFIGKAMHRFAADN